MAISLATLALLSAGVAAAPAGEDSDLDRIPDAANASRDIAISFLRLANLASDIVDRLGRNEAAL